MCYNLAFVVIFDSASDICDLKIIKDVAEANLLVNATGQQYSRKANDARTITDAQHNDKHISPKAQDNSIVSFQHLASDITVTAVSNAESAKGPNVAHGFRSATCPKKTSVKAASRGLNSKKSQNVATVDSRSSPHKKQINGCLPNRHPSGAARVKGYDTARINGCSPNDLSPCVQKLTVSDEVAKTADSFSESNHKIVSRKQKTSGMDIGQY